MAQGEVGRGRTGTVLVLVLVVAVVVVGLLAFRRDPADRAERPERPEPPGRPEETSVGVHPGRWTALDPPPLTPRWGAAAGWVGGRLLVVGGAVGRVCEGSRCPAPTSTRDGAAYDPAAETWSPLPEAPVPVRPGALTTSVGGAGLVVLTGETWLAYDDDRGWRRLPPPGLTARAVSSVDASRVYALGASGRVAVLDLAGRSWRDLPRPPGRPVRSSTLVADRAGVSLVGSDPTGERLDRRFVVRWSGTSWTRTSYPAPGLLTGPFGVWRDLPAPPGPTTPGWVSLPAGDGRPATSGTGYVWDPDGETWVGLGRPGAAVSRAAIGYAPGRIYLVGGYDDRGAPGDRAWVWSP